jgi:cell division FtsZ-interacting protein ZapD
MLTDENETAAGMKLRRGEVTEALAHARSAANSASDLARAFARLSQLIAAHGRSEESKEVLEQIVHQAPRLDSGVRVLEKDHEELPGVFAALSEHAQALLLQAEEAFDRLAEHQSLADHLLYEAYSTDIGGG